MKNEAARFRGILVRFGRMSSLRDPLSPVWAREGFQMTPVQFHIIMWLGIEGSLSMKDLAARSKTTLPNCTRSIDKLINKGLVLRERDPKDRRSVLARLSAKGLRLQKRLDKIIAEQTELFLNMMGDDDRANLLDILERVANRFSEQLLSEHRTSSEEK